MILLFSCNGSEDAADTKSITEKEAEIKVNHADTVQVRTAEEEISKSQITIQVYYTFSYCGGAPPNEEILAEANKQRWFQESEIRLRKKGENETDILLITDAEGKLTTELPYGEYSVLVGKNTSEQMNHLFNPECKQITERIWKDFKIDEKGINGTKQDLLKVVFNFPCDPCDLSIKMRP